MADIELDELGSRPEEEETGEDETDLIQFDGERDLFSVPPLPTFENGIMIDPTVNEPTVSEAIREKREKIKVLALLFREGFFSEAGPNTEYLLDNMVVNKDPQSDRILSVTFAGRGVAISQGGILEFSGESKYLTLSRDSAMRAADESLNTLIGEFKQKVEEEIGDEVDEIPYRI